MRPTLSIVASLLLGTQAVFAGSLAPPVVEEDVTVVEEAPAGSMGMSGGLGTAAAVGGGLLLAGGLAAIIGDDDDESSTTTTIRNGEVVTIEQ